MTGTDGLSRRVFLARLGIGFNAIVAVSPSHGFTTGFR